MTTDAPPLPDTGNTPAKENAFQRIVGVFFAPGETFQSIARRPDVLVPLAVVVIVTLLSSVVLSQRVDFKALSREAIESSPRAADMSPQQMEQGIKFTTAIMKVSMWASPVLVILALVITAGVLLIAFRLMAGEGDFKQALSAATYAWMPRVIKGILAAVVIGSRKSLSIFDLQNPLRSNLGFLFDPKHQPIQTALASSIDVFAIWSVVLLIIGFAAMSKLSRGKSAAIVLILWVVVNLLSLIGPAMQAMGARS